VNSEERVNELVDLCNSIHSTNSGDTIASLVRNASRIIHPSMSLFLLKFVSAYSKKDQKFVKSIVEDLHDTVLFCYQSCSSEEKETIRMYISGWRMRVSPWPEVGDRARGTLDLFDNRQYLLQLSELIKPPSQFSKSLLEVVQEGEKLEPDVLSKLVTEASERLSVVITGINEIRNMVGT